MGLNLGWALWLVGGLMIIASWAEFVTPDIGWIGFGIAVLGMLMSSATRRERYERDRDQAANEKPENGQES